jgi:hypothetical protein
MLAPLNHMLPKNLIMALLYMLHIACVLPNENPYPISTLTEKALRSFGNWTECLCGCRRLWNFACGIDGLRDDTRYEGGCVPGAWKYASNPNDVLEEYPLAPRLFKRTVRKWSLRQEYPVTLD